MPPPHVCRAVPVRRKTEIRATTVVATETTHPGRKSLRMNTYARGAAKPCTMNTYGIASHKPPEINTYRKSGVGGPRYVIDPNGSSQLGAGSSGTLQMGSILNTLAATDLDLLVRVRAVLAARVKNGVGPRYRVRISSGSLSPGGEEHVNG
jgi:hypothetical protein